MGGLTDQEEISQSHQNSQDPPACLQRRLGDCDSFIFSAENEKVKAVIGKVETE